MLTFIELDYKITTEFPGLESRIQRYSLAVSQATGADASLEAEGVAIRKEIDQMLMLLLETKMHLQGVSPSVDDDEDTSTAVPTSILEAVGADWGREHQTHKLENARTMQHTKILNDYIEEYVRLKQILVRAQSSMSAWKMGVGMASIDAGERAYDQAAKMTELVSRATNLQGPIMQMKQHQLLLREGLDEDARLLGGLSDDIDGHIASANVATGHAKATAQALCRHNDCKYMGISIGFAVLLIICLIWI